MKAKPRLIGEVEMRVRRKPYSFKLTASTYNFSWWYDGEKLVLPLEDDIIAVVEEGGGELKARIYAIGKGEVDLNDIVEKLEYVLGVDEDLGEFYEKARSDPILSQSVGVLRGLHIRATTPWMASIIGVCQQNASFKQGWRMLYNMLLLTGRRVRVGDFETFIPPKPQDIVGKDPGILRKAGVGYRARTIIELAKLFTAKEYLNTWRVNPSILEEELLGVKGVGNYTTRLTLILSLRYYEKPPIDRWLRRLIIEAYRIGEDAVEEEYVRRWGRWSGLAALFTTIAIDAEPLSKALDRLRRGELKPGKAKISPLTLWKHL